jgi:hypothetical protein
MFMDPDADNTNGGGLTGTIPTEIGLMTEISALYGPPFFLFHPLSSAPTFGISPWRSAMLNHTGVLGGRGCQVLKHERFDWTHPHGAGFHDEARLVLRLQQ